MRLPVYGDRRRKAGRIPQRVGIVFFENIRTIFRRGVRRMNKEEFLKRPGVIEVMQDFSFAKEL